jgi:hypothetical protein
VKPVFLVEKQFIFSRFFKSLKGKIGRENQAQILLNIIFHSYSSNVNPGVAGYFLTIRIAVIIIKIEAKISKVWR